MSREYLSHQQHKTHIRACTNGPLTYVRTLKNASSFFYNNLVENFKWWPISWQEIQWHETHVFSHIQDPIERRHKGILEYLIMTGCVDLLQQDKNFQKCIAFVPYLDEHTESLLNLYGSWCFSMDWIPLYDDKNTTVSLTEKLLRQYGQRIFPWDHGETRSASDHMKNMAINLRNLWGSVPFDHLPGHVKSYLSRDINLYHQVMLKFNPNGDTWPRCSWLRQD